MTQPAATILIVDDDVHVRDLLEVLLQNQGYETLTAESGEQALAMVDARAPDLILLDIMMPGMDGYEVASVLKAGKGTANIPIIMLSALDEQGARLSGLEAGAEEYLSKPVESAELWLRVRNLLRLKAFGDYLKSHSMILEDQLQQRTIDLERFRTVMDASEDAIFLINRNTMSLIEFNRRACQLLGYTAEELAHKTPAELGETSMENLEVVYDQIIAGKGPSEPLETQIRDKSGRDVEVEIHRQAYRTGEDWVIVGIVRDITQRKESDQRLLTMAHYDTLTGLPNRDLFFTSLQMGLTQAAVSRWKLATLTVNLDGFKNINETWGHVLGDQVLLEVSHRLSECINASDTLGRVDGDQFALILMIRVGQPDTRQTLERIRKALRVPFMVEGQSIVMTASIGIALYPEDGEDARELVRHAYTAMNSAKKIGPDTYRFYTAQMNADVSARLDLEAALRDAVEKQAFEIVYQPKLSLVTGRICGLEALLRWPRPGQQGVSPAVFVPVLESLGLIGEVGNWVVDRVCAQIAHWQRTGLGLFQVAVNVSGQQISNSSLVADIRQALTNHRVAPQWLEVELTESSLMENTSHTIATLETLKANGVSISIDDFGTGYSSLAYLRRFPIDKLKIDIAFIREVTSNPQDAAIARAIIELAHSLGLKVIAEGVETPEQLAFLRDNQCDQIQGYLISKPLPLAELETFLSTPERQFG
ncbi:MULTISPECIES: putative bifunctional diguanylate cyclase/phosphodiesterase [Pseudomonas syringae group]|uniref:cyclic-guanylate-specific phosphodiesterase n=8 Tax=Pseudomonas syringae group TaxID=136849 RepID=A0AAW4DZI7_PSESX|nr:MULTISPECIES: EAL domain-containing protein [Pseudomonas syringae group]KPC05638.1 Sensory box protein/response regulator [Pseudomonas amygdali pv. lachrymans]AAO54803.1 sensory box protein/response regulator [Pseudomonas syringae pv. tomato str. DC3000]AVI83497.1 two-component system response regulator [Pseudomonas syringae pv. tomato]EEB60566.1 sensory box protein/response regulator [Pseudomonas syringae pv. tomato T1]EGH95282.1 sensory box protein/response regulator [Pseudomonas amygdali